MEPVLYHVVCKTKLELQTDLIHFGLVVREHSWGQPQVAIVRSQYAHSERFNTILGYVDVLQSTDGIIGVSMLVAMISVILRTAPGY